MIWKGKTYKAGQEISEWMYEDFIDIAYGRGENLKETKLWKDPYRYGFVCPDEEGGWIGFAYDGSRYLFLGTFSEEDVFYPEVEDFYDYSERMLKEADRLPSVEALEVLRTLYLDPRSKDDWTDEGLRMASDPECMRWFSDYWDYVRWCEHGNECSLSEVQFKGFVETVMDPGYVLEYLLPEGDETDTSMELAERLRKLNKRYAKRRKKR